MLRPVHLAILLFMVVLVASLEEQLDPARQEAEPPIVQNANDLEADASSWGSRPWRYGWRSGWNGWRGGGGGGSWGWGGRVWPGRSGWW